MKATLNKQEAIEFLINRGKQKAEEKAVVVKTVVSGVKINPNAVKQSIVDIKNRAANAINKEIHRFDTPKKEIVVQPVKAQAPDQSQMKLPVLTGTAPIVKEPEPAKDPAPKKITPKKAEVKTEVKSDVKKPTRTRVTKPKVVTLEEAFDKGVTNEEFSKLD